MDLTRLTLYRKDADMPLLDIRKQFIIFSGRYDLIVDEDEYVDNGADFFIRSGQRWLDRFGHIYKAEARWYETLTAGDWFTSIPSRTVREVWVSDNTGNKWQLRKMEYKHLRHKYRTDPGRLCPSKPRHYAVTPIRTIPEITDSILFDRYDGVQYDNRVNAEYVSMRSLVGDLWTLVIDPAHQITMLAGPAPELFHGTVIFNKYPGVILDSISMFASNEPGIRMWMYPDISGQLYIDFVQPPGSSIDVGTQLNLNSVIMTADSITLDTLSQASVVVGPSIIGVPHYADTGLVFLPPAQEGMELEVLGAFEQPELKLDTDTNYWTEEQPIILVMAACRSLEMSYRNKEGVADWEAAIKGEILGLEFDLAETESNEFTQMEG